MQSMNMLKIQRKIFLEDALPMIFIDFGLLRSPYCKISDLLADIRVKIWPPTYDSVCEDNRPSLIHGKYIYIYYEIVHKVHTNTSK